MLQGAGFDVYVIDTCSITDLEVNDRSSQLQWNAQERARILDGIERLILDGRMVTVSASRPEMQRHCPKSYDRFKGHKTRFFRLDTPELLAKVTEIFASWPTQARKVVTAPPNRDAADPYLIAYAEIHGCVLVTSEKPKRLRTKNNKTGLAIPDVCESRKPPIRWYSLVELVNAERL